MKLWKRILDWFRKVEEDSETNRFRARCREQYIAYYGKPPPKNFQPVDNPVTRVGDGWKSFIEAMDRHKNKP